MIKKYLIPIRRLFQTFFLLFLIYIIWNTKFPLKGVVSPEYYFYLDPLIILFTAIAERVFIFSVISALVVIGLSFIYGRVFCGWFCPMGALMDFFSYLRSFILSKWSRSRIESSQGKAKYIKYVILVSLFFLSLFGIQSVWIFDPLVIFVRAFSFNIHPFINNSINSLFVYSLKHTEGNESIETIYNFLREGFLSVNIPSFPHTNLIFGVFLFITISAIFKRRFWCRYICPLGALLALPARFSIMERRVSGCNDSCNLCDSSCPTGAIVRGNNYHKEECIMCVNCTSRCTMGTTIFILKKMGDIKNDNLNDEKLEISRRGILKKSFLLFSGLTLSSKLYSANISNNKKKMIRPPGSLQENNFIQRCIRCGNCMKICPTNVLQPSGNLSVLSSLWTPYLDIDKGYCEYNCNLCGQVCPTDAIEELSIEKKVKVKIGIAEFDKSKCLPWLGKNDCLVCEEHCPVTEKAIRFKIKEKPDGNKLKLPYVVKDLCIGCGICEYKCPVSPDRAIKVKAF